MVAAVTLLHVHVVLSLVGIAAGFVVLYGLIINRPFTGWTAVFLGATILTSLTGFPLPPFGFDPPRAVGTVSVILLVPAVAALYAFQLRGRWRWIFVGSAITALYLNVFVAIIQAFLKIPFLHALAPTQSEEPFVAAQAAVLVIFVVSGIFALRRFDPDIARPWQAKADSPAHR